MLTSHACRVEQAASSVESEDAAAECEVLTRQELPTDHLAGVFRNFSAYKKGREALLTMEGSLFLKMCTSLRKGSEARRVAIAESIRNVALDPSTASKPVLPELIATLALPFAPGCELHEEDAKDMPLHLLQVPYPIPFHKPETGSLQCIHLMFCRLLPSPVSAASSALQCALPASSR